MLEFFMNLIYLSKPILLLSVLTLFSCSSIDLNFGNNNSYLPDTFNSKNIMRVSQGMSSKEVLNFFGAPNKISQTVCASSSDNPWPCITWEYGNSSEDNASFTFNGSLKPMALNHYNIDRGEEPLSSSFSSENILNIRQGMGSKKILKLFGAPKSISQTVCASKTDNPWNCITWEYGTNYDDRASFTFNDSFLLNHFNVDKE